MNEIVTNLDYREVTQTTFILLKTTCISIFAMWLMKFWILEAWIPTTPWAQTKLAANLTTINVYVHIHWCKNYFLASS